jgi:hypothetical protein
VTGADPVPRPLRRTEYAIFFISRSAEKGWPDSLAIARNAVVDAWERLTTEPAEETERQYRLKGDLATGTYQGRSYERWQYKLTDGGRLWYYVEPPAGPRVPGRVLVVEVSPGHPKQSQRVTGRRRRR